MRMITMMTVVHCCRDDYYLVVDLLMMDHNFDSVHSYYSWVVVRNPKVMMMMMMP